MKTEVIFLFTVVVVTASLDLPSNFKICNRSDPKLLECLTIASRDALVLMAKGLKSFKIFPIEPMAIDSIKIGEAQGSVSLKQEYRNIKLHGLTKELQLSNYRVDWNKVLISFNSFNPQVDFVADYKIEGKILLLPIYGDGKSNITMYNMTAKHEIIYDKYQKNRETYLKATKYTVKLYPQHVLMRLENLFNGDPVLGEQMNKFINENSELLFQELQEAYEETFGLVFVKLTNDIFSRVPMKKIFPST